MSSVVNSILHAPAWLVFGLVGLVVFAEDALFVGFVLPGETAAILGGVAASRGHVSVVAVMVVVVAAAIIGDSVGYEVGRQVGTRVLALSIFDKRRARLDAAQDFLARRGGSAVFLGRWVAFFRAVMPALAGTTKMRYVKFLAYNAAGGIVWGVAVVLVGYLAGNAYAKIQGYVGTGAAVVVAVIVIVALVVWRVRKAHSEKDPQPTGAPQ
jgi:membrane protein DedA with SNARE-associated domain